MAQQNTTADEDQITIGNAAEAADILTTNLTSAELSEFSREHGVLGYSGKAKRAKAENAVLQQPEAVAEWLEAQDLVTPTENLATDLYEDGLGSQRGLAMLADEVQSRTLERRLNRLHEAVLEAPHAYEVTHLQVWDTGSISLRISAPDEHWTNEGETGTDRFRARLGEQGGLEMLEFRDDFSGYENDLADSSGGFRRFCKKVRTADSSSE